jgi:hypothetical protein
VPPEIKVQTLGKLRMRGTTIDGLGFLCLWYPASSSRRVWHGLADLCLTLVFSLVSWLLLCCVLRSAF